MSKANLDGLFILQNYKSKIYDSIDYTMIRTRFEDILWISTDTGKSNYCLFSLKNNDMNIPHPCLNLSLQDILKYLPPFFVQVHRSYIVNIDAIDILNYNHLTIGQDKIPISRKYRTAFLSVLQNEYYIL